MNDMPRNGVPQSAVEQLGTYAQQGQQTAGSGPSGHKSLLPDSRTGERKIEHVRLCLNEDVAGSGITTGFEQYRFRHNALPELDYDTISLGTEFLGRTLRTPLLISSMTGGARLQGRSMSGWPKRRSAGAGRLASARCARL